MKKLLACALALALVSSLGACKKSSSSAPASSGGAPASGGSVYYLNFKPEIAPVYDKIAAAYEAETGVRLHVVTAASGTYEQTLKSEIAKADAPTLFQINGPKGYAHWKDYCADLSGTELVAHLTDPSLAVSAGGKIYAIPYVVEGYGILYNDAILQKYFATPGAKAKSVDEIKSFAALKSVVEDMTAKKDTLGIRGVFASTSLKPGEDWRWHTHLANLPLAYEFSANQVDLASDATREIRFQFADNFKKIFDLYLHNSVTEPKLLGSRQVADSMAEFALGQCAMVQNGNWAWGQIREVAGNVVEEQNVRFLPIYTGMPEEEAQGLCIGTENFFAINAQASPEQQKLAADFIWWLYSSETGKRFVTEELGFIAPFDTFSEQERPADPLAQEVLRWMNKKDTVTIPWNFTVFPSQSFKDQFGAALLQYAQGTIGWDEVVSIVVSEWKSESAM